MTGPGSSLMAFTGLSLARRPELFEQIRACGPASWPYRRCTFAGRPGWIVAQMPPARVLLTSSAGRKSRPESSQRLLGGVGALRGERVREVKRELVDAMRAEARRPAWPREHLRAADRGGPLVPQALTETLSGAMLAQLTGRRPGTVDGARLRRLVSKAWSGLEGRDATGRLRDELAEFIAALVHGSDSAFLMRLRGADWSADRITEELRAMVLAGWGSTTAATLSALALGVSPSPSKAAIDEVLRLYPPSFMIARTITEPPPAGLPFALGDLVLVSPWLIHRDPAGWSEPGRYAPDRRRRQACARWFLPFGLGPRRCPAATFAQAQIAGAIELYAAEPGDAELSLVESRSPALVPRRVDRRNRVPDGGKDAVPTS
jgi:cytochrome P450